MKSFDVGDFKSQLDDLENLLVNHKIQESPEYKEWYGKFKEIYGRKEANLKLYSTHAILITICMIFIHKYILKDNEKIQKNFDNARNIKGVLDQIDNELKEVKLIEFDYFNPFFLLLSKDDFECLENLSNNFFDYLLNLGVNKEYWFDFFIQNFISSIIRHKSGEFYTPPFLIKKMLNEHYKLGEKVLDCCCGTGNFLIEIVKLITSSNVSESSKNSAIKNVFGYDINPILIFITKVNVLYILANSENYSFVNLTVRDSLFPDPQILNEKFDLIIGNPPWYTYSDIQSNEYQEKIKNLAEELEIKPRPKNILNIEISGVFFYRARELFMKMNSKIFFVITKGVITGSHSSRFRNFNGFKEIKIWTFDKKIEKIFNIDFICLFAKKSEKLTYASETEIPAYNFGIKNEIVDCNYFMDVDLELKKTELLIPYYIERKLDKTYTHKLISKDLKRQLLPCRESYYKKEFHKGADLNPRNLIFVNYDPIDLNHVKINPNQKIFKQAKSPWTKIEFTDELIEKKYLFKVAKSTELVKFYVYDYYDVFLPLSKKDLSYGYDNLESNAKKFYNKINKIYLNNKKETTKHNSLMDNLDRWSKLINERQKSDIKVIYNNSGSILNSAVIQGNFLVTGDVSFFATDNLDEAHYLAAILNSNIMTKQIQIKKSSRHIFKLPFDSPIKRFDPTNKYHLNLVNLGKKGQEIAISVLNELKDLHNEIPSKIKIQNILHTKLEQIIKEIDECLELDFLDNVY